MLEESVSWQKVSVSVPEESVKKKCQCQKTVPLIVNPTGLSESWSCLRLPPDTDTFFQH